MAYRDDFYKAENIIGHTGDISKFPSIYFKVQGNNRASWARVTTDHDNKKNIGRAIVRTTRTYEIRNDGVNSEGKPSAQEWVNGSSHHVSRNLFVPVNSGTRSLLMEWVERFPHIRQRHEERAISAAAESGDTASLDELFGIGGTT